MKRQQRVPGDWIEDAACRAIGGEAFFPPDDKPVARDFYRNAKKICEERCRVRKQCAAWGADEEYGVFGGTTPVERRIQKEQAARPLPPEKRGV